MALNLFSKKKTVEKAFKEVVEMVNSVNERDEIDKSDWVRCYLCGEMYPPDAVKTEELLKDSVMTFDEVNTHGDSPYDKIDDRKKHHVIEAPVCHACYRNTMTHNVQCRGCHKTFPKYVMERIPNGPYFCDKCKNESIEFILWDFLELLGYYQKDVFVRFLEKNLSADAKKELAVLAPGLKDGEDGVAYLVGASNKDGEDTEEE